ncbi:hypothetical protein [Alkalicoccus chagannorensis]|uniref:hypothetical protein n=1 Tax=Alkalicoccus chagannorensis TaxID=427072 RepID=UPI000428F665|nr:hypothetical protein [Alkalicoccus chagannorensis]
MNKDEGQIQHLYQLAASLQQELPDLPYVPCASPVLWNGDRRDVRLLTVGTNPSPRDFAGEHWPDPGRYAVLPADQPLSSWAADGDRTTEASRLLDAYFQRDTVYSGWFGKPGGAGLEAVVNGFGASFYEGSALHMDLFPFALNKQMGKLRRADRDAVFQHPRTEQLLRERIAWLDPPAVLLLGRRHARFLDEGGERLSWPAYPMLQWQRGRIGEAAAVQLDAKPSEPFLALGSRRDAHGIHTGSYAVREVLLGLGGQLRHTLHA